MTTIEEIELVLSAKDIIEKDIEFFQSSIDKNEKELKLVMEKLEHLFEKHAEETKV